IAYSNAIAIPFHGDDYAVVVNNTALHSPASFAQALDPKWPRPVAMLTLCLNWWLTKGNATSFHVVNLAIHLINGVLVFLLCRLLLKGKASEAIAMLAGLIFVLHPALTESVNLAIGRAELLATLFSLSSLLLYVRATKNPYRPLYRSLCLSWLCYFLACYSKEITIFLPVVFLLFDLYLASPDRPYRTTLPLETAHWTLFAMVAALGVLGIGGKVFDFSASNYSPAVTLAHFGELSIYLVRPVSLNPEHNLYIALPALAMIVPWLLVRVLRTPPLRVIGGLAAAALVITAGVATFLRNNVWIDEPTLWQDAAAKAPNAAKPQRVLGRYYLALGRDQVAQLQAAAAQANKAPTEQQVQAATEPLRQAEQYFTKAKELDAQDSATLADLGATQSLLGKPGDAVENLLAALRQDTSSQSTTLELATALDASWRATGKRDDLLRALDYFKRAETLGPLPPDAAVRYGMALLLVGNSKDAEPLLQRVIGSDTNSPLSAPLKDAQERQKKIDANLPKALALYRDNPRSPDALRLLGQLYILSGHFQNTLYTANLVLKDSPQDLEAWIQMGVAEARMNAVDQFATEWPAPAAADSPWRQLALTCATVGLWDEALAYLGKDSVIAKSAALQMGEFAIQLKQMRRAWDYFRRATEATPGDPRPWLRLADIAGAANDTKAASDFLVEAANRNADPSEVAARRQKLGVPAPAAPSGTVKSMIR
ncbi:MAG: hypothetical protein HZB26_25920, partial [Candidatus Hydrogenedentes bacterium]|nr:hypothetical protein [Candidatus Hydrogenedentota bacterium]